MRVIHENMFSKIIKEAIIGDNIMDDPILVVGSVSVDGHRGIEFHSETTLNLE